MQQDGGEKARLKKILRERLEECGWRDEVKQLVRERIVGEEGKVKSVETLTRELSPQAQAMVPDSIKADLLQRCRCNVKS